MGSEVAEVPDKPPRPPILKSYIVNPSIGTRGQGFRV